MNLRRTLVGTAAAVTVFGGVYGLAASLNLTSDSLGAGSAVVAACQTAPLNATYTSTYSATTPGYNATTVTVAGMATTCQGKAFRITLSGAANASLGEATGTTPTTGTTFSGTFTNVSAAAVTGVAVVISG